MATIENLGWHTLNEIIQMKTLCMVYTSLNGLAPRCLTEISSGLLDKCKRGKCNTKTDLELPLRKSGYGQKCFSYKRATMWNNLCSHIKMSALFKAFKKA